MYKLLLSLTFVAGLSTGAPVEAKVRMGENTNNVYFTIDDINGEPKTPVEADAAAKDHTIYRCKPIKNSRPAAHKCDEVVKEFNARTGAPSWKRP